MKKSKLTLISSLLLTAGIFSSFTLFSNASASAEKEFNATVESIDFKAGNYHSVVIVVLENKIEKVEVKESKRLLHTVLENRGYETEKLRDENGDSLKEDKILKNDEIVVVYASTIDGSSKAIELPQTDIEIVDHNLYKGERIQVEKGAPGAAVVTEIISKSVDSDNKTIHTTTENQITVITAPKPGTVRVGDKKCDSEYACDLAESERSIRAEGEFVHPLGKTTDWSTYAGHISHDEGAIDFPVSQGTPIYAIADGTVVQSTFESGGGGNMAVIEHDDENHIRSVYAHMVETPLVSEDDEIKAGQLIGFVGSTGNSTGPHLHFEIRKGEVYGDFIPAYSYLKANGIDVGECISGPCELSMK